MRPARSPQSSSAFSRAKAPSRSAAMPIWSSTIPHYKGVISVKTQHVNNDYNGFEGMEIDGRPSVVTVRGKVQVRDGVFVGDRQPRQFPEARTDASD